MTSTTAHFKRPTENAFTRDERQRVTLLFNGLTTAHDRLMAAGLNGLGYRARPLRVPEKMDFQTGKEYGNNGQCNPTYFTVGNLINELVRLRDEEGLPTERILADHAFVTVGTCGPCRFGMDEAEYRLALRNAGFDGFRVLIFDQTGAGEQRTAGDGFEVNLQLFTTLLDAVFMGDLLNALFFHLRPYAIESEAVARARERCLAVCEDALRERDHRVRPGLPARALRALLPIDRAGDIQRLLERVRGDAHLAPLRRCREIVASEVEVDYIRPKPVVKVTGEFWAQTTEGDGNFQMFDFLEREGAEVLVEPVATWIDYLLHQRRVALGDRAGLADGGPLARLGHRMRSARDRLLVSAGERLLAREYHRMREALGGTVQPLADQLEMQRVGHPFYNIRASGGEGYLEVAKNIYYFSRSLAHMTLSLKPFGCMPSTQSDGAQAAVMARYPELNYLPVETSGEGSINAYSRVQMSLGEAKSQCKREFEEAVTRAGRSLESIRAYVAVRPALRDPIQRVPRYPGVIGRAANFVLHVGALMDRDGVPRREATTA
ncbi:activator of (R)-2-hydroxyglutaryl-CoA dehydratase [Thioalkalivibrio nitratireducens]|uniref:activator of (R)-2-hydroxyglutaryl-CoA dehydratase n=1 Tax=Thioalkalivibrio nitratireducens TaxID=186931 RepID=UPI0009F9B6F4|nr:activator of (R)-2-hydroxyglutaryl-CoA dehydratase [Thioalkalivibrio nitratireducens]